jgi:hypothetical protein
MNGSGWVPGWFQVPEPFTGGTVAVYEILAQVDRELDRLTQARALLISGRSVPVSKHAKKRNLTPEGRRRIIEAVKRRWAAQRITGS